MQKSLLAPIFPFLKERPLTIWCGLSTCAELPLKAGLQFLHLHSSSVHPLIPPPISQEDEGSNLQRYQNIGYYKFKVGVKGEPGVRVGKRRVGLIWGKSIYFKELMPSMGVGDTLALCFLARRPVWLYSVQIQTTQLVRSCPSNLRMKPIQTFSLRGPHTESTVWLMNNLLDVTPHNRRSHRDQRMLP